MNYKRHYQKLCQTRKDLERSKGSDVYYENHHIIPASLGGSDEDENLVLLTAREHYIAHWLLHKIHNNRKMACAWYFMSQTSSLHKGKRITSQQYERARKAFIESPRFPNGSPLKGRKRPQEVGDKISKTKKGIPLTEEHKAKLRKPKFSRITGEPLANPPGLQKSRWKCKPLKVSNETFFKIRQEYKETKQSYRALARKYKLGYLTIRRYVKMDLFCCLVIPC